MALKLPIRSTDTIRVIAPGDDAIDWEATPTDGVTRYYRGEYDLALLRVREGREPSYLTLRPLTDHERTIAELDGTANPGHQAYQVVRLGLVAADLPGWTPERELWCGSMALTQASLEAGLDGNAVLFACGVIRRLSTLPEERRRFFAVSAPSRSGGTTETASTDTPTASAGSATVTAPTPPG